MLDRLVEVAQHVQRLGVARITLDPADEEAAAALELAVRREELGELEGGSTLGRHVAIALGAAAQSLETVDEGLGDALLVELVGLGQIGDGGGVVAELLAEARADHQQFGATGARDRGERLADRPLCGIELARGCECGGVVGDELDDVRRPLPRLTEDLGGLEGLTEEPGVCRGGFAEARDRSVVGEPLRILGHQLRELRPQLVVAVPLLEPLVDVLVVGRRAVRELERALDAAGVAGGLPHRGELAGERGCALRRLDGEQALHEDRALARVVVVAELTDHAAEDLPIVGRDDQGRPIDPDRIGRLGLLEQIAEARRDIDRGVTVTAALRILEPRPQELGNAIVVAELAQRGLVVLGGLEVVGVVGEAVAQDVERVVIALEILDQEPRVLEPQRVALGRGHEVRKRRGDHAAEAVAVAELAIDREQRLPYGAIIRLPLAQELVDLGGDIDLAVGEGARRDPHREPIDLLTHVVRHDRRDLVRQVARLVEITGGEPALGECEHRPRRGAETIDGVARRGDRAHEQRFGALLLALVDREIHGLADLVRRGRAEAGAALEEVEQQLAISAVARDALVHRHHPLVVRIVRGGLLEQPPGLRPPRLRGERALEELEPLLAARFARQEDLGEAVQRVDLRRRWLGIGAGELEHLVECAGLLGGVAKGSRDARLCIERLGQSLAEDLDAAVQARGTAQIVRVLLECLAGAHEQIRDERRIVLTAEPVGDLIDGVDELLRQVELLRELPRALVQLELAGRRVDRLDQRIEGFVAATETVERLGHIGEQARLALMLGIGVEALRQHLEQQLALVVREQRAAQAANLGVRLDRGLHRRLEELLRLIGLAARLRQRVKLEQHFRGADGGLVIPRRGAAHDEEQRAIGALRLVELTRGARHLGELLLDRGI